MTISDLHKQSFNNRISISDNYTTALVKLLTEHQHFKSYRKASLEEDMDGIDFWVTYPKSSVEIPVQFKIRDKQKDIPVCRYQPFYGIGHEKTIVGRDFRSIKAKKVQKYYIAIRNGAGAFSEVYNISSDALEKHVLSVDESWNKATKQGEQLPSSFFTPANTTVWLDKAIRNKCVYRGENGDVWWKKNHNEKSPKFNIYIPYYCKEWGLEFSQRDSQLIEEMYKGFV